MEKHLEYPIRFTAREWKQRLKTIGADSGLLTLALEEVQISRPNLLLSAAEALGTANMSGTELSALGRGEPVNLHAISRRGPLYQAEPGSWTGINISRPPPGAGQVPCPMLPLHYNDQDQEGILDVSRPRVEITENQDIKLTWKHGPSVLWTSPVARNIGQQFSPDSFCLAAEVILMPNVRGRPLVYILYN